MRISTNQMFNVASNRMSQQQAELVKLQQQLATGKRVLSPSDDPVASSTVLTEKQTVSITDQFQRNIGNARNRIRLSEGILGNMVTSLQDLREILVAAGNGTLTDTDRASLSTELTQRLQELIGQANSSDGNGHYLFAGYQDNTVPYSQTSTGATYVGDSGQPLLQVDSTRYMAMSDPGSAIFEAAPTGNGTFATTISDPAASPAVTNAGTGLIDNGKVITPSGYSGQTYILKFNAGGSTYDVIQRTNGVETTLSTNNAYGSGAPISLAGGAVQVSISGAPVSGDRFVIAPSSTQNIFTTLQSAITALNTSATTSLGKTVFSDAMRLALTHVDQGMQTIQQTQTSMGARLRELDSLENGNEGTRINHIQRVSELEDVDYTKAASDLTHGQIAMQAAQSSFVRLTQMSLFDYMK